MEIASIGTVLLPLAILACPVGMGLMMLFMVKGMSGEKKDAQQAEPGEVEALQAEQKRLAAEVERLERERASDGEVANALTR